MKVVMSGLPASGKSTLGRALAGLLRLPVVDKDDALETLFANYTVFTPELRGSLSRESNVIFKDRAMRAGAAILISFWRRPNSILQRGTPSDWLLAAPDDIIEVHCKCGVDVAVERFLSRKRHPGHMDSRKNAEALSREFAELASEYPLGVGRLVEVNTASPFSVPDVQHLISGQ